nr:SUMF1/EgtB/PvdO family nonheme iron enzyme [Bacteroidota bacterium]
MNTRYCFITLLVALITIHTYSQKRVALVIGNAEYKDSPLKNPVNDAIGIATTLSDLGFSVALETNLNWKQMENAIRDFGEQIENNDVALFYFSGHGTQVDGENYLIPVGEDIASADEMKYKCVNAGMVLDKMESAENTMKIFILDACRDNPFRGYRSNTKGFALMSASTGTFISYATAPGSVAQDGTGHNSPYTKYLIEMMKIPGLKIEEVFKKVREKVMAETGEKQVPWESSSMVGDFYFKRGAAPDSGFRDGDGQTDYSIPAIGTIEVNKYSFDYEMVRVKGGSFKMGDNSKFANEKPEHRVSLDDFYIGKFEISQEQWMEIMESNPGHFEDCPECPVESVSWDDIQNFIDSIHEKTGVQYRLPTEAEWEYAARGGVNAMHVPPYNKYAGSDNLTSVAWFSKNSKLQTKPVGEKDENELGVFDMSGNVWEWCSDRYGNYSDRRQKNPKGLSTGNTRVIRGGAYNCEPKDCRVTVRSYFDPDKSAPNIGFRLVRDAD